MKLFFWVLIFATAGAGAWFIMRSGSTRPEIRFVKPRRETLVSSLPTNGKIEPIEWTSIHADMPGLLERLLVRQGENVRKGALVARIAEPGVADQVHAAQARVAQAQAALDPLTRGGAASELTDIDNQIARAEFDRAQANKDYNSLRRLSEKQAATPVEVETAHARVQQFDLQVQSLQRQRAALVGKSEVSSAQARVREAQATVQASESKLAQAVIRSPLAGVVYDLPVRQGAYLNAGDLIASVGQIDRLRVRVYVDEPELGRVAVGQPVKITWDALPDRSWQGTVERLPTEITALGTRQVGEVLCTIDNPGHELVPGTNVNAFIQTSVVPNALTIPKELIQRNGGITSVFVLDKGDVLRLRRVELGTFNVTRTQVVAGLHDDDLVALSSDNVLRNGERVRPVLP